MREGNLLRGDLHAWFGVPRPTIRYWLVKARPDFGPQRRAIWRSLAMLEWGIEHGLGFPVPDALSYRQRPAYVRHWRDAIDAQFPRDHAALARMALPSYLQRERETAGT